MAEQYPDERKIDISSLPRGAIGIKGFPVSRNTRLPSIRSPRDLTLGAQPKRSFVPNIPVRREKRPSLPNDEKVVTKSENVKNVRSGPHRNERGRGRGRGREFMQTQGSVFGEGIAPGPSSQMQKDKSLLESGRRSANASNKNSFKIKIEKNEDKVDSMNMDDVLNSLLRDDFVEFEDEGKDDTKPIVFPFPDFAKKEEKVKEEIKTRMLQTKEENEFVEIAKKIKKETVSPETNDESSNKALPDALPDVLSSDEPLLLLLQFPDCVAALQKNEELEKYSPRKDQRTNNDASGSSDEKNNSNGTSLTNMSEGYIGKLQILKSGKTRLILGSLVLHVEHMEPMRTKHEVACVRTNVSGGDMTILGHVYQKLKCIPNIENLI